MGYSSADDGPEARLFRLQALLEQRRHEQDTAIIERLLWELTPEDATRELFSWATIKEWGLKRRRKR